MEFSIVATLRGRVLRSWHAKDLLRCVTGTRYLAWVLLLTWLVTGCNKTDQVQKLSGFAQGTNWHVSFQPTGDVHTAAIQELIDNEFVRLDTAFSNYRTDSVIEGFNTQKTTEATSVGQEIVFLIKIAREVSEASQGCYDLTIKPLFDLWGFSTKQLSPPNATDMERVLGQIGFEKLEVLPPDQLRKIHTQIQVDLSSIAQGYSVGRIATVLEDAGVEHYLVEIGGELQTRGHKPDGSYWRIGVERPLPGGRSVQKTLTIGRDAPLAVMTSGTYRHYFDEKGQRYSHVLDARTGRPVEHNTVSVTVLN